MQPSDAPADSIPATWSTFDVCRFETAVMKVLLGLNFPAPTQVQAHSWPRVQAKRDLIGVAKTGSGKTFAFLVPAFDRIVKGRWNPCQGPCVLVLAPTRELACQICQDAKTFSEPLRMRVACLYGGRQDYNEQLGEINRRPHVVIGCPGRVLDFLDKKQLALRSVRLLVLDEADRMLDMGFIEQVRSIITRVPAERQTLMFTATWQQKVQSLCQEFLQQPEKIQIGSDSLTCNDSISQEFHICLSRSEKTQMLKSALETVAFENAIVFVNTKAACAQVRSFLAQLKVNAVELHGDLPQVEREEALARFRAGGAGVIVATDVAARGLDVKGVKVVVCFDLANDEETHVHRIGRTGRAGAEGKAVTLVDTTLPQLRTACRLLTMLKESGQEVGADVQAQFEAARKKVQAEGTQTIGDNSEAMLIVLESSDDEEVNTDLQNKAPMTRRTPQLKSSGHATTSSIAQSIASGSTYFRGAVEELLGHAASKDISQKIVGRTAQQGFRMLTHASTGAESSKKPFRWMFLRCVPWAEVMEHHSALAHVSSEHVSEHDPGPECVWHTVIADLGRTKQGKTIVPAHFFHSNMDTIFREIRDKFAWLEDLGEDDPDLITTPLGDENFMTVLKYYFECGDTQNQQHYLTLAKLSLWEDGSLLHYCCKSGFARCVELLLAKYSTTSAPGHQPWLQLADPLWQEKAWGNSAFHTAAWAGHADVLRILLSWAEKRALIEKVRALRNTRHESILQLVESRLKKMRLSTNTAGRLGAFQASYDVVAPIFRKNLRAASAGESTCLPTFNESSSDIQMFLEYDPEHRRGVTGLSNPVTLRNLADTLAKLADELHSGRVDSVVLVCGIIEPEGEGDALAAGRLLQLVSGCRRVVLMKCKAPPAITSCLCEAFASVLRWPPPCGVRWSSVMLLPEWTTIPQGGCAECATALKDVLKAICETSASHALTRFDLPKGTATRYLPPAFRFLPPLFGAVLSVRSIAWHLLGDGPEYYKTSELYGRLRKAPPSDDSVDGHNPLLSGPACIERKLLDKAVLMEADSVLDGLNSGWGHWVAEYARALVSMVLSMPQWASLVAGRPVSHEEEALTLVRSMADEAMLVLLRMRGSSVRPGLEIRSLVEPALRQIGLESCFARSLAYFHKKLASSATRVGDGLEEAPQTSREPRTLTGRTGRADALELAQMMSAGLSQEDVNAEMAQASERSGAASPNSSPLCPSASDQGNVGCSASTSSSSPEANHATFPMAPQRLDNEQRLLDVPADALLLLTFKGSTNIIRETLLDNPLALPALTERLAAVQDCRPEWAGGALVLLPPDQADLAKLALIAMNEKMLKSDPSAPVRRWNQLITDRQVALAALDTFSRLPGRRRPKLAEQGEVLESSRPAPSRADAPHCDDFAFDFELLPHLVVKNTFYDFDVSTEVTAFTASTGDRPSLLTGEQAARARMGLRRSRGAD